MAYSRLHLLSIPSEIRMYIWKCIYDDILNDTSQTYEQRLSYWSGLAVISPVICREISEFWPRTRIPYHKDSCGRSYNLASNLSTGLSKSQFMNFRHLTLQLPNRPEHDPGQFYHRVAVSIQHLATVLQDLRIFFIGEDKFNVQTNYVGCGLKPWHMFPDTALSIEGSYHLERGIIFRSIHTLSLLRRLVLSNVNYPILQGVIGGKPYLESLHVTADARSQLFIHHNGPIFPWEAPPALKKLDLCANAVLGAARIASSVLENLEDLTFLVPTTHWQYRCRWHWLNEVGVLVADIGRHARKLSRFRLCIEQRMREETAPNLLGYLKLCLPRTNLQVLEIHASLSSDYFGAELIASLPATLKRLCISEELVRVNDLVRSINTRYFAPFDKTEAAGQLGLVLYGFWEDESNKLSLLRLNGALLDRERNLHLLKQSEAPFHRFGGNADGFPVTIESQTLQPLLVEDLGDDEVSPNHAPEGALLHYCDRSQEHVTKAEMMFHAEAPVKPEDRLPFLLIPDVVPVGDNDHWMSDQIVDGKSGQHSGQGYGRVQKD